MAICGFYGTKQHCSVEIWHSVMTPVKKKSDILHHTVAKKYIFVAQFMDLAV